MEKVGFCFLHVPEEVGEVDDPGHVRVAEFDAFASAKHADFPMRQLVNGLPKMGPTKNPVLWCE